MKEAGINGPKWGALERREVDCCEVFDGSTGLFWECLLVARLGWPGDKVLDWLLVCQRI